MKSNKIEKLFLSFNYHHYSLASLITYFVIWFSFSKKNTYCGLDFLCCFEDSKFDNFNTYQNQKICSNLFYLFKSILFMIFSNLLHFLFLFSFVNNCLFEYGTFFDYLFLSIRNLHKKLAIYGRSDLLGWRNFYFALI